LIPDCRDHRWFKRSTREKWPLTRYNNNNSSSSNKITIITIIIITIIVNGLPKLFTACTPFPGWQREPGSQGGLCRA
jgi:hypothetical protein